MRFLLPPLRFLLMVPTLVVFFLIWGLGLPFVAFSERAWARWRAIILRRICSTLLAIMGARVECKGEPPRPPFVLVSNHLSYIDILVLASRLDTVFVSKQEVASWPVIGFLCRLMGTIFIQRERRRDIARVLEEMEGHLARDSGIVFFPEGTSTNGAQVLDFRPSLLEIAVRLGRPVSYASLRYTTSERQTPADDSVCWWGDQPFIEHFLRLLGLPGFRAQLIFGSDPIRNSDRKTLAVELREAVAGQLPLT